MSHDSSKKLQQNMNRLVIFYKKLQMRNKSVFHTQIHRFIHEVEIQTKNISDTDHVCQYTFQDGTLIHAISNNDTENLSVIHATMIPVISRST